MSLSMLERLILLVAPVWALVGAAAFVCATVYLVIERCAGSCTGFLEGMNQTPGISSSGLVILGVVLVLACVGRRGRGFAAGFFAAFVGAGIATSGGAMFVWKVTPGAVWRRIVPSPADRRTERILDLRTKPLDERAGGVLIYRVLDCIGGRRPQLAAEIVSADCQDLAASLEGYAGPLRFSADDPGWRWSYRQFPQEFVLNVYPDAMLSQSTPQFTADQTGRVTVRRAYGPPSDYPRPR
jgi:hypothetical protein